MTGKKRVPNDFLSWQSSSESSAYRNQMMHIVLTLQCVQWRPPRIVTLQVCSAIISNRPVSSLCNNRQLPGHRRYLSRACNFHLFEKLKGTSRCHQVPRLALRPGPGVGCECAREALQRKNSQATEPRRALAEQTGFCERLGGTLLLSVTAPQWIRTLCLVTQCAVFSTHLRRLAARRLRLEVGAPDALH